MNTHKLGDTLYFHAVTTDDTGAAVAPTSIVTTVYLNGSAVGALTAVAMTSMATGLYTGSAAITAGNGFADGDRLAVFATAVMSGVSKVALLCEFEVSTYAIDDLLAPTTAGRKLDVSAGGEAGLDWANVGGQSSTVALTDTVIATASTCNNAYVTGMGGNIIAAAQIASDAVTEIQAGLATAAALTIVGDNVAAVLADTGTDGVVVASGSKSGYALSSTGLDSVATTAPSGVASNFREMVVQTWRRFFKKAVHDTAAETLKTYADDGTTLVTTQTLSESGDTETQGAAS